MTEQRCAGECAGSREAVVSQAIGRANSDATLNRFNVVEPGASPLRADAVAATEARAASIEQIVASNVAIADQTDGAARLMLMAATVPVVAKQ